jgi:hypothetical protein
MLDEMTVPSFARESVTKNLPPRRLVPIEDVDLMHFVKNLRYLEQTRRYSIAATDAGWEVREERDREVVRREHYRDWHRVERARRSIAMELDALRNNGWRDEN